MIPPTGNQVVVLIKVQFIHNQYSSNSFEMALSKTNLTGCPVFLLFNPLEITSRKLFEISLSISSSASRVSLMIHDSKMIKLEQGKNIIE